MSRLLVSALVATLPSAAAAHSESKLSGQQASELAARIANEECQRRFERTPFKATAAVAQLVDGRWRWKASAGFGRSDLVADVSFSPSGEHRSVTVHLMDSRRGNNE